MLATGIFAITALYGFGALVGLFGEVSVKSVLIAIVGLAAGAAVSGVPWPRRVVAAP